MLPILAAGIIHHGQELYPTRIDYSKQRKEGGTVSVRLDFHIQPISSTYAIDNRKRETIWRPTMRVETIYPPNPSKQNPAAIDTKALAPFMILTFALTWGLAALFFLFTDQITAIFGEASLSNPLVILAVYSPGLAGIIVAWRYYGYKGLGRYFQRLALWRIPRLWWLFLILGIPAVVFLWAAKKAPSITPLRFLPGT
jgi:hypothetical protein